ncbi:MAG: ATP-binding protein, partial [Rhodospirillaceae bacterium]|nr:ATP-binding protein [Rhodospirillaceae bacterium]
MTAEILLGHAGDRPVTLDIPRLIESRMLVQANSGGGKSWAIRRILEQAFGHAQILILDPEGEFYTLREKYDYVLAGRDGDCPAEHQSAALLARKFLEIGVNGIFDISELKAHERILFVKRFLEGLVNAPRKLWHPALVIVDEAHMFCPEKGRAECSPAVIDLMTRGRKRGFCGVLATQRISKLNKDAAAEANNKMIGRAALDIDMKRAADELGFGGKAER